MRIAICGLVAAVTIISPANAQQAGTLISADPVVDTPAGMQAWRMQYWTRTDRNRAIRATGMVVAPREAIPREPRNVLARTHGTWGVASKCAPSLSTNFWQVTPALQAVARGYTVVAPDYPGLGGEGVHPFLVEVDTGRSVLDAVRAARGKSGAATGNRVAVWGESQGGHAALWIRQIARAYAPDVRIVGVAAAAPPTELISNLRLTQNTALKSFFTSYIGYSWSKHYAAPLASFGGPQTQGIMTRMAQNNCIEIGMKPKLGMVLGISVLNSRLKNIDVGRIQPWATLARHNSPTTTNFAVPLLIAQSASDDLVAPLVTRSHAKALCRSGARVRWIDIKGGGHATSAKDSAGATLKWIDDRFSGARAPSDCGHF